MTLQDILTDLSSTQAPILLNDGNSDWEAGKLLEDLSQPMLKRPAHMQTGLYIAEINESGYLGRILYRLKDRT